MNDLISRQAAIDAIGEIHPLDYNAQAIAEKIKGLPSARTERKKGDWKRHMLKNANVPWGYDCSTCGTWFVIGENTANKYNYCPNCGADMRGENDVGDGIGAQGSGSTERGGKMGE